jgi:signal recognition particle receptor subunit beta
MEPSAIDPTIPVACISTFGLILTTLITSVVAVYKHRQVQEKNKEIKDKDYEIQGYHLPVQVPKEDRRNTILLIALGGVGKTTLIRSLFQNEDADPNEKTGSFDIYRGIRESSKEGSLSPITKYWFHIADYKGQNIGQLVSSFIEAQKKPYSPLAYGFVDSLILMVDLWPPKAKQNDPDPRPQSSFDAERVKRHLHEWNDTALNAIFGLLTDELRYVCLFINKIDLMADRSDEALKTYEEAFRDLANKIEKRCRSQHFEILLGSARDGTALSRLEAQLMEHSVTSENQGALE